MDVPELLRTARARALFSQRQLARAAGTSQGARAAYESGRAPPTVQTLNRVAACCDLQVRAWLEPLLADVDALLNAALAHGVATGPASRGAGGPRRLLEPLRPSLRMLQRSLDLVDPIPTDGPATTRLPRRGPVTWAVDGASALALHGLAVPHPYPELVVVLDEALRWWLRAVWLPAALPDRRLCAGGWLELEPERFGELLHGRQHYCPLGLLRLRVVDRLPPVLRVVATDEDGDLELPLLGVDEVGSAHPAHADLLARWRQRRTVGA